MSEQGYEGPAILEVMGHQQYLGHISEAKVAGVSMVQIEAVGSDGETTTKYFGAGALYCITPTTVEFVQGEIDERRAVKRQVRLIKAVNDAWFATLDGTDPYGDEWCHLLFGTVVDANATELKREEAGRHPNEEPEPAWLVLVDGTELHYTKPWASGGSKGAWILSEF